MSARTALYNNNQLYNVVGYLYSFRALSVQLIQLDNKLLLQELPTVLHNDAMAIKTRVYYLHTGKVKAAVSSSRPALTAFFSSFSFHANSSY